MSENGDRPELPEGWEWKTLGDIGDYHNGRGFKKSEWSESGRPIIRIQNLTDPTKPFNHFDGEPENKYTAREGDILMSWAATLDVFRWRGPEAVVNQHIFKVESKINPDLHFWLLKSVVDELYAQAHGTGMVHVTRDRFLATPVPVPPSEAQPGLVSEIKLRTEQMDGALSALLSAREKLRDLRRSSYSRAIRMGESSPVGDLLRSIEAGKSFRCEGRPARASEWGILKVSAMSYGAFREDENKAIADEANVNPRWEVCEGDLLFSRANTTQLVGASVLVPKCRRRLLLSDKSLRLVPKDGINALWLHFALSAPATRAQLSAQATGTKDSMRNISQKKLRAIRISVPPPEQQARVAKEIEAWLNTARTLELAIDNERVRLDRLRRSALRSAILGQSQAPAVSEIEA